jgi:tetratricopeptide (TPR) repeat protein
MLTEGCDAVFIAYLLMMGLLPFSASGFDGPGLLHPVTSAKHLNGRELLRIAEIHDVQNHYQEALTYYELALESFRSGKQRRDEAVALFKIGLLHERQGVTGSAGSRLREALALFSRFPDHPAHADALLALGRVSAWLGAREEAARFFSEARDRYKKAKNAGGVGSAMTQLGLLWISDEKVEEGIALLEQALQAAHDRQDDGQVLAIRVALGDGRSIIGQPDAALASYEAALALARKRSQARLEADLLRRQAHAYEAARQPDKGIEAATRAVTLYQVLRDQAGEAASWSLLASLLRAAGEDDRAEEAVQRALLLYRHRQLTVHAAS